MRDWNARNKERVNQQRATRRASASPERRAEIQRLGRERDRRWRERNPEHARDLGRKRRKAYYYRNAAAQRAATREYRKRNPEKVRQWRKEERQRNVAYYKLYFALNKAMRKGARGVASPAQVQARMEFFGCRCWMCGGPFEQIDHVIPISKGGTNWPANLRPACKLCNNRKNGRRLHMGLVEPAEARVVHYEEGPDAGRWRVELWQEGQLGPKCVGQSSTFDNEIQCAVYVKFNYPHLLGDELAALIPADPEPVSDETEAVGAPEPPEPKGRKPREPKDE